MKKIFIVFTLILALTITMSTIPIEASKEIKVSVNGQNISFPDAKPFIDKNNRTLIPVRFVSQALGAEVKWDGDKREVLITLRETNVKLRIDDSNMLINNRIKTMDTKAVIAQNRTFVPVRFVSEALGAEVLWNASTYTVIITTKDQSSLEQKVYKVNPNIPKELYEYEYRKREWDGEYATNKWMVENYGESQVTEWMNIGKGYMESFYNVDYRSYDKSKYIEELKWFFMPQTNWRADDGVKRPIEDHIKYWADMVQQKQIVMKTEFITDPSLVYSDGDFSVRGEMKYIFESCNDTDWLRKYTRYGNVEIGKWYKCVVDVQLVNMELLDGWDHAVLVVSDEFFVTSIDEVE
ncbi:MAG: copper amine oxidase N-terminal domain-containing protein [Bacillota bacterium]